LISPGTLTWPPAGRRHAVEVGAAETVVAQCAVWSRGSKEGLLKAALDRYTQRHNEFMAEALGAPTVREFIERMLLRIADLQTDPDNPPGCLLVAGGLACGAGSENVPFELAARRAQKEQQLRERFIRAREEGDLAPDEDPTALAKFVSAVISGMGVLAASGSDREELRRVAMVAVKVFDKKPRVSTPTTDAAEPTIVPTMPAA